MLHVFIVNPDSGADTTREAFDELDSIKGAAPGGRRNDDTDQGPPEAPGIHYFVDHESCAWRLYSWAKQHQPGTALLRLERGKGRREQGGVRREQGGESREQGGVRREQGRESREERAGRSEKRAGRREQGGESRKESRSGRSVECKSRRVGEKESGRAGET